MIKEIRNSCSRTPSTIQKAIFAIENLLDVRVDTYLPRLNLALNSFSCQALFPVVYREE